MNEPSNNTRFVTIKRASELTGYTEKAIRRKMEEGVWREGQLWVRAPDSRIHIDMEAYGRWVRGELNAAFEP